ncbi:hypothetical protein [Streptacidiphilus albus]|uniref:hypothetical protein n=1 Tax=Streptacidiphilus albus TaxID=105425 RepID=UPI00068F4FB0|nr:hypothetical protein [Streptacidiphilus albus]
MHLLTTRRTAARIARALVGQAAASFGARIAEHRATTAQQATQAPAEDDAELYTPDDMPPLDDIMTAASAYFRAADQARTADRAKRAAKKILNRLPVGRYGTWDVTRETSGRETADLDKIRAIFKAHNLGPVPMKANAPSLKVRKATVTAAPVEAELSELVAR